VLRILLCVLVGGLGCTKDAPSRREPPQRPQPTAPEPARPAPKSPFGGARLIVDATSVKLDGVSLGTSPAADQLAKLPRDAVALAFTDDAPADRVLGVLSTLQSSGRARVELTALVASAPKVVCPATVAPASAGAIQLLLAKDRGVAIGLEGALAVFRHERATGIPVDLELETPFFADTTALALAAEPGSRAGDLAALLDMACQKRPAVRVIPAPPPPRFVLKPLCRKVLPKGAFDADKLRDALPSLEAMDLCYQTFEPNLKPRGTVTMRFDIEPTGLLSKATAKGINPDVDRCLTWLLKTVVVHPPPAAPTPMVVTAECNTRCCTGD
jgi:hypothetical protein